MREDAGDNAGRHGNQQKVTVVAAHPVIATWRLPQVVTAPVVHHISATAVVRGHPTTSAIPAFMTPAIVHAVASVIIPTVAMVAMVAVIAMITVIPMIVVLVAMIPVVSVILRKQGATGQKHGPTNKKHVELFHDFPCL